MHDLNKNLFYKTSFQVESKDIKEDVIWSILMSIRTWVVEKCERNKVEITSENKEWTSLKWRGSLTTSAPSDALSIESCTYKDAMAGDKWSCLIQEKEHAEGYADREWTTEIGFSQEDKNSGTISIILAYGDQPGFLGPRIPEPTLTIPGIIRILCENSHLRCSSSGIDLWSGPIALTEVDFKRFWDFISSTQRSVPAIYVSPNSSSNAVSYEIDPIKISEALGPSAIVFYAADFGFSATMTDSLKTKGLHCSGGSIRVYAAKKSLDKPWQHRYFTPGRIREIEEAEGFIPMLRRALAQDVHFYEEAVRVDDLKRSIRHSKALNTITKSALAERAKSVKEQDEMLEGFEFLYKENETLSDESERLKREKHNLQLANENLQQELKDACTKHCFDLFPSDANPEMIVRLFLKAYADQIDMSDQAWTSLKECTSENAIVWDAMYYLSTEIYNLWTRQESTDIEKEFNSKVSGFEYSRGEGKQSNRNKKTMDQRKITYQKRTLMATKHLKSGSMRGKRKDKGIRLYFAFDDISGKIIIGSIGPHLDNATTKNLK